MRVVTLILIALLILLQYPLWLGHGGWLRVWELHHQIEDQQRINVQTRSRNAVLDAQVRDLKQGTDAIEELARSQLGMVKSDELFFQILDDSANQPSQIPAAASAVNP
ncbi:MAG: cell division protein FtsB [Gallionella sp.]|nr:cell division protein FtsB [Gallionella sp.]